ncbi:MAG: MFS transporter [Bdellovibrio sp.]|nr:MFS transporter [Bdellovibrio sp.]
MLIDISPLFKYKQYRYLYFGQTISTLGSMITYVALPYQIYQLTHSSLAVGLMGTVELAPLLITSFLGGHYADQLDRRKVLLYSEFGLCLGSITLVLNSLAAHPSLTLLYCVAAAMSALNGFHRPALESLTPRLVKAEDLHSISALTTLKGVTGTVVGPALAGLLLGTIGLSATFMIDALTYGLSILALSQLKDISVRSEGNSSPIEGIKEGLRYAWSRPELLGSYLIDFVAMIFGMPMALFPAFADNHGGTKVLGLLYAAPSIGAVMATLASGWTGKVQRLGAAIAVSAVVWGIGITLFGSLPNFWAALAFLGLAGIADAFSGMFRMTLWNRTIPDRLRGRMAGLEMLSYMSGPLLGNAESGLVAAAFGTQASIVSGGILCIVGVALCIVLLPAFWKFRANFSPES